MSAVHNMDDPSTSRYSSYIPALRFDLLTAAHHPLISTFLENERAFAGAQLRRA